MNRSTQANIAEINEIGEKLTARTVVLDTIDSNEFFQKLTLYLKERRKVPISKDKSSNTKDPQQSEEKKILITVLFPRSQIWVARTLIDDT